LTSFEGKPFNALNDLVVTSKDGVYFTDSEGVYYLPPGGPASAVKRVISDIENPNGVQLSPDEKTLYANDKDGEYLLAFDIKPDGTLSNRPQFRQVQEPQGRRLQGSATRRGQWRRRSCG
jgi:gluconolactonase